MLRTEAGERIEAVLHDVSLGGLLIEVENPLVTDAIYEVLIPGVEDPVHARAIATARGLTRLEFTDLKPQQAIALLKHIERDFAHN